MPDPQPVADALSGEMLVPSIGCSSCREKDQQITKLIEHIAKLERHIQGQDHLIGISHEFIKAVEGDQVNREARRAASRRRSHLASVPKGTS